MKVYKKYLKYRMTSHVPNISSSNFVLMIGGQILVIVLALIVLFFGTETIYQTNQTNPTNRANQTNRANRANQTNLKNITQ
jgi:hypothetical protein